MNQTIVQSRSFTSSVLFSAWLSFAMLTLGGCALVGGGGNVSPETIRATGADRDANALCVDFTGPGWSTKTRYLSVNRDVLRSGGAKVTQDCGIEYQDAGKGQAPSPSGTMGK